MGSAVLLLLQKVAVYEITLEYSDGGQAGTFVQPNHIAEQQEDCTWRSRLGDLGVFIHDRADQLESKLAAETIAKGWADQNGITYVSAKMTMTCYAKKHARSDYHGKPGPLSCSAGTKEKKK